jgi:hypothetical protein
MPIVRFARSCMITGLLAGLPVRTPAQAYVLRNAPLRVSLPDGRVLSGRLLGTDSTTVLLRMPAGDSLTLQRRDLALVEEQRGQSLRDAKSYGILGAAVGGALGLVAGVMLCDAPGGCGSAAPAAVGGAALVGGGSAVLGAFVGLFDYHWVAVSSDVQMTAWGARRPKGKASARLRPTWQRTPDGRHVLGVSGRLEWQPARH